MLPQQYCLRWKYHHSNLQTMFSQLLERQAFCDVTLACEGRTIKAHKMVLSACSTYFDTILSQYEEKDPILIMKDVKFVDIKCLVEFMYKGEINVEHCHLATLLKTAEELRIKGLAEVSWRDDEACNESSAGLNGIQSVLPQVATVMDTSSDPETTNKRKRGRPPIDDYDTQSFPTPKMTNLDTNIKRDSYSDEVVLPDNDNEWEDDHNDSHNDDQNFTDVKTESGQYAKSENGHEYVSPSENETASHMVPPATNTPHTANNSSFSSNSAQVKSESLSALEAQWPDVIKMNDYLNTGRRPQFWEEPFTRRVMEAIKSKELEMKSAAELLGVSYGTLYGRYRDAYGCLKHPYRVRDFWTDQGPADILAKLQRKEMTLFRAAEQLNVTPQTLSNYLISLNSNDADASTSSYGYDVRGDDDNDGDSDNNSDSNHILPDSPSIVSIKTGENVTKTVLPNHPDITIIKKEKVHKKEPPISSQANNHPDDIHSDTDGQ